MSDVDLTDTAVVADQLRLRASRKCADGYAIPFDADLDNAAAEVAERWTYYQEFCRANGFDGITDAVTRATKAEARAEKAEADARTANEAREGYFATASKLIAKAEAALRTARAALIDKPEAAPVTTVAEPPAPSADRVLDWPRRSTRTQSKWEADSENAG